MRLGIACYVFQRTIDKTCLYRGDTFVEASSLPLLFPFFHASAPLRTRSTETTNGDDERVKAKHLPAEYGYAINSKERATSALLFYAASTAKKSHWSIYHRDRVSFLRTRSPMIFPRRGTKRRDSSCRDEQKKGTTRDRDVTCSHVDATVTLCI